MWSAGTDVLSKQHYPTGLSSDRGGKVSLFYGDKVPTLVIEHEHDTEWSRGSGDHRIIELQKRSGRQPPSRLEVEAVISDLLTAFRNFTARHNLTCWLTHGSLLGMHRDHNIIPWDEDADVAMTADDMDETVRALRSGDAYPGHKNIVAIRRFGPDSDCIGMKFADASTGIYVDVMPFAERNGGTVLWSPCTVHKGPGHEVTYPRAEIFPLVQCRFAGSIHWCPRQVESYLLRSYDSLDVPRAQLHGKNRSNLSPWYLAKAQEFKRDEADANVVISQCCNLPRGFSLPVFGVGNMGTTGASFELRISLEGACVVVSTTTAATYDDGDLKSVSTKTAKECVSQCAHNPNCTHFTSRPVRHNRQCLLKHEQATLGGAPESWVSGKIVRLGLTRPR